VVNLLMQRGNLGDASFVFMNQMLGILRDAGFSDEETHHAWQMLASHTMGYAFQQSSGGWHDKDWQGMEAQLTSLGGRFPHVTALAPLLAGCEFGAEYAFGLEIIVGGLEARLG
jgi:TetR/AcrR family tetracycline transcriptional repressor